MAIRVMARRVMARRNPQQNLHASHTSAAGYVSTLVAVIPHEVLTEKTRCENGEVTRLAL